MGKDFKDGCCDVRPLLRRPVHTPRALLSYVLGLMC